MESLAFSCKLKPMSPIETAAAALGLVNITLIVRRSVWNYPFGLVMVTLYAFVFFGERLYSDAILQVFFFVVQLYGWWAWSRARADEGEVKVELLGWPARGAWLAGILVAAALWGWLMHSYTDAHFPWWDAGVAMFSVAGQILMSRRFLENWWCWIAADLLAIPLYATKAMWPTTALYVVFLGFAIWGAIDWAKAPRGRDMAAA